MINKDDLNRDECFVCKKHINTTIGKEKFVYLHFTNNVKDVPPSYNNYLYFHPDCFLSVAGEDYFVEGYHDDK